MYPIERLLMALVSMGQRFYLVTLGIPETATKWRVEKDVPNGIIVEFHKCLRWRDIDEKRILSIEVIIKLMEGLCFLDLRKSFDN